MRAGAAAQSGVRVVSSGGEREEEGGGVEQPAPTRRGPAAERAAGNTPTLSPRALLLKLIHSQSPVLNRHSCQDEDAFSAHRPFGHDWNQHFGSQLDCPQEQTFTSQKLLCNSRVRRNADMTSLLAFWKGYVHRTPSSSTTDQQKGGSYSRWTNYKRVET